MYKKEIKTVLNALRNHVNDSEDQNLVREKIEDIYFLGIPNLQAFLNFKKQNIKESSNQNNLNNIINTLNKENNIF